MQELNAVCDWQVKSWWSWERRMSRVGAKGSWTAATWASTLLTMSRPSAPDVPPRTTTFPKKATPSLNWSHWTVPAGAVWRSRGPASHRYIYTGTTGKRSHLVCFVHRLENLGSWCHGLTHGFVRDFTGTVPFLEDSRDRNKAELQSYSSVTTLPMLVTDFCFSKGINIFTFPRYRGASPTLREVAGDRVTLIHLSCTCEFQIYQKSVQVFISARSSWLCLSSQMYVAVYIFFFAPFNRFSTWGHLGWAMLHIAINLCRIPESIGRFIFSEWSPNFVEM